MYAVWRTVNTIIKKKEVRRIDTVRNFNGKRVCDISGDRRVIEIVLKGCVTRITANPDGTLKVENDIAA